jgi:hypothetical protein
MSAIEVQSLLKMPVLLQIALAAEAYLGNSNTKTIAHVSATW